MKPADMILKSNAIFRGYVAEPEKGIVVIRDGEIQYVGDEKRLGEYVGEHTEIYELGDKLVMPGLHDAHLHFYMSGLYASPYVRVSFSEKSEAECVAGMSELAERTPKDKWLIGAGWYHPWWTNPVLPTKKSLDEAYPDRPVCMVSWDCHTLWLNSKGLEKVGLTKDSVAPAGGSYDYLEDGELSGTIHEAAAQALLPQIYTFSEKEENDFYKGFTKALNSYGITSVCDMTMVAVKGGDFVRDDIFERLLENGELTVRVNMYPLLEMDLTRANKMREKFTGQILRCQGLKLFLDGVSSCHTAYLKEDYANAEFPGDHGKTTVSEEQMRELVLNAAKNDFSVRIHAIGDQAIHAMLDIYEEAEATYGRKPYLRHTLEHMENFQPEDIARMAKAHVLPSVQPLHAVSDMEGVERDLGAERVQDMWPFRRLLDTGSTLAFGTDSPVVGIQPFVNIYSAVTRQNPETQLPEGGWTPHEKITLVEALSAYTYGSACAACREDKIGTLAPGKLADVMVWNYNPFEAEPEKLLEAEAVMTIMDGKIVYRK